MSESFRARIPIDVYRSIKRTRKIKRNLDHEIDKCLKDMRKGLNKYSTSIRQSVSVGKIQSSNADKRMKTTRNDMKREL